MVLYISIVVKYENHAKKIYAFVPPGLTCGGFNHICFTLDLFDDCIDLDNVGNPWSEIRYKVGIFRVRNLNLLNN